MESVNVNNTNSSRNEMEKARIIGEIKQKRRRILSVILIFPMACAIIVTCLGIWIIATMPMTWSSKWKTVPADLDIAMILLNNSNKWESRCRNMNPYPVPLLQLLTLSMVGGGYLRCESTACLYHQAQSSLEKKHLKEWIRTTVGVFCMTKNFAAYGYETILQERYPHSGTNTDDGSYNMCDVLYIILLFSLIDLFITNVSLFLMNKFIYNDAILEKEYADRVNARARRE